MDWTDLLFRWLTDSSRRSCSSVGGCCCDAMRIVCMRPPRIPRIGGAGAGLQGSWHCLGSNKAGQNKAGGRRDRPRPPKRLPESLTTTCPSSSTLSWNNTPCSASKDILEAAQYSNVPSSSSLLYIITPFSKLPATSQTGLVQVR